MSYYLSDYLDTKVEIGRVNIGLLNQATFNDIIISDQQGKTAVRIDKASARIELLSLLRDTITVSSVNIYGFHGDIYRNTESSDVNIQFIIEKLKGKEKNSTSTTFLVNNIIIGDGEISYNVISSPSVKDHFDKNHILISDINTDIQLNKIQQDSLDIYIKRLYFKDSTNNTKLNLIKTQLTSDPNSFYIHHLNLSIDESTVQSDLIVINKSKQTNKITTIIGNIHHTNIHPEDIKYITPNIKDFIPPFNLSTDFEFFADNQLVLNNFQLNTEKERLTIDGDFQISDYTTSNINLQSKIRNLSISSQLLKQYLSTHYSSESLLQSLSKLGDIKIQGITSYTSQTLKTNSIIESNAGSVSIDAIFSNQNNLKGHISTKSLHISDIMPQSDIHQLIMDMDVNMELSPNNLSGTLKGGISNIIYKEYGLNNININGVFNKNGYKGQLSIHDPQIELEFDGLLEGIEQGLYHLNADVDVHHFQPNTFGMKVTNSNNIYDLTAFADVHGSGVNDLTGLVNIKKLNIHTPETSYTFNDISADIIQNNIQKELKLKSEIANVSIGGMFDFNTIISSLKRIPNAVIPSFIPDAQLTFTKNDNFQFDIQLFDHPFIHTLLPYPYQFTYPLTLNGQVNTLADIYDIHLDAESLTYDNHTIKDLDLSYKGDKDTYSLSTSGIYPNDNKEYHAHLTLNGKSNQFKSHISILVDQEHPISGDVKITGKFNFANEEPLATISIEPSTVSLANRQLNIQSPQIQLYKNYLTIQSLNVENESKYLTINGVLSEDSTKFISADLNGSPIGDIFEIINANVSNIDGYVYGKCNIYNVLSSPKIDANMTIQDLQYKDYVLGNAFITANWDNKEDGIKLHTQIIGDDYKAEDRMALVNGYIYPAKAEIDLHSIFKNIDAIILQKLIGRTFKSITGKVSADVGIYGPFSDIQFMGEGNADAILTLRATNVGYHVDPKDKIRINTNSFTFNHIHISDKNGHINQLNGVVGHRGFRNFSYTFDMDMDDLLLYEESTFNSDKFKGTVYADGKFHLQGSDGHPLYINADIAPSAGSEFCYDAATPDAITGSNFLRFHESTPSDSLLLSLNIDPGQYWSKRDTLIDDNDDISIQKYRGDIFMNINIHMNHNCPVKLKMDNVEDGYITTFGTGVLQASYHNKGSFTLNGTYNIQNGKYKLYLQDIIYRDLVLQEGSQVVFNGNPFDANIHLVCWYTLNSVPLSDLTSVTYTQNNRVKVVCVLDITGKLGNMAFNFDLSLPNVSDETRQIVRSYISTDEEMNKQIIYLLGFGRFFTNEYARTNGEANTNQAVNNLLSSTLSGQLNQMLTNVIGNESKWNFGTGLSTGERGWEDMDVEGNLSGRLLDDRLLINGNFGYRDNSMTNNSSFVGDVDVKWRLTPNGNTYLKAYNLTNDRYFTKSTLNTQGIGATYQKDFETWTDLFRRHKKQLQTEEHTSDTIMQQHTTEDNDSSFIIIRHEPTELR